MTYFFLVIGYTDSGVSIYSPLFYHYSIYKSQSVQPTTKKKYVIYKKILSQSYEHINYLPAHDTNTSFNEPPIPPIPPQYLQSNAPHSNTSCYQPPPSNDLDVLSVSSLISTTQHTTCDKSTKISSAITYLNTHIVDLNIDVSAPLTLDINAYTAQ